VTPTCTSSPRCLRGERHPLVDEVLADVDTAAPTAGGPDRLVAEVLSGPQIAAHEPVEPVVLCRRRATLGARSTPRG